jgi:serine/threonine protein kinase/DNA-binding beta-propeller fold protein YncE
LTWLTPSRRTRGGAPDGQRSLEERVSEEIPSAAGGFTAGSQIAGYRLEEQIGRGGMAVVFRAHDSRLDRMVALKILAPGLALDDAFRQRFIRESRAAAAVDDPHIIPVFEAGEASGVLFIAMRYVRGGDVRTLLDQVGPLPPARATEILSQVASALDAAHVHGLVHRDVKPANMLLDSSAGTDRPDHVYLSDFGLSKQALAPSGITSTGQFLGTLDYVAPEQIEGRKVDGRADLYALACAAFELLSGAPPFRRDEGLAVVYAQLSEPPPSLAARRPGLPQAIDRVMAKAMAKSPADRYQSCRDFVVALREVFGLRSSDSGPTSSPAPNRPATELAMPVAGSWADVEPARQDEPPSYQPPPYQPPSHQPPPYQPPSHQPPPYPVPPYPVPSPQQAQPAQSPPPVGPQTQAAGFASPRGTKPGLTDPRYGPPGQGGGQGYDPPGGPRRRSRKAPAAAAAAVAVLLIGGGAFVLLHHTGPGAAHHAASTQHGSGLAVAAPGCTTATASAPKLAAVGTVKVAIGGKPFGVLVSRDGRYSFVSLGDAVAVLNNNGGGLNLTLNRTIPAPGATKGEALTGDGKYLLVADDAGGAVVISTQEAEQGAANPIVGHLSSQGGSGAVEVAVSPDDKFAFVTLQNSAAMAVFNLKIAESSGFSNSGFVGFVQLGSQPVGIAESPDGTWLYVTSMQAVAGPLPSEGTVSVVSMARAEANQKNAVVSTPATAGCAPSRVMTSADGSVVWVTTQQSNALLAFSAAKLRTDPAHSLIAKVAVGQNPIGETFIKGGTQIVVADSDKTHLVGSSSKLTVVNTKDALASKPALVGLIRTGNQPREFVLEGGQTLLVTNTGSGQLEAVTIGDIP